MIKNAAAQHLSFQMNLLATGANALGLSPTITVSLDGAAEAPGSGGVSETANGGYTYLATQAETNCDHLVVAMIDPLAITQRINVFPVDYANYKADVSAGATQVELDKVIKSGETAAHVQGTVNSNTDVEVTTTRV